MNLTDPNLVLTQLERAGGSVIGLMVQLDFKRTKRGKWPDRVELFKHIMSAKGLTVEYICSGDTFVRFLVKR